MGRRSGPAGPSPLRRLLRAVRHVAAAVARTVWGLVAFALRLAFVVAVFGALWVAYTQVPLADIANDWQGEPTPEPDGPAVRDIHLTVVVTDGVEPLTEREKESLRRIWRTMPVERGNATGFRLHVTQQRIDDRVVIPADEPPPERIVETYYEPAYLSGRPCETYQVVLLEMSGSGAAGWAYTPGYHAVVDGTNTGYYLADHSVRVGSITHELLHNVVGQFENGDGHTDEGWLSDDHRVHGRDSYLSNKTARKLSTDGIAAAPAFEARYC